MYNAFIKKKKKNDNEFNSDANILDIGNVSNNARINENATPDKKIAVLLVDTKYLINCYYKREEKKERELIENIISAIEFKQNKEDL